MFVVAFRGEALDLQHHVHGVLGHQVLRIQVILLCHQGAGPLEAELCARGGDQVGPPLELPVPPDISDQPDLHTEPVASLTRLRRGAVGQRRDAKAGLLRGGDALPICSLDLGPQSQFVIARLEFADIQRHTRRLSGLDRHRLFVGPSGLPEVIGNLGLRLAGTGHIASYQGPKLHGLFHGEDVAGDRLRDLDVDLRGRRHDPAGDHQPNGGRNGQRRFTRHIVESSDTPGLRPMSGTARRAERKRHSKQVVARRCLGQPHYASTFLDFTSLT